jgi:hypothetical protein
MLTTMRGPTGGGIGLPQQEMTVLYETRQQVYELHWMRHADRYLALVRAALTKDPRDLELLELLLAMEAAMAERQNRPLH